MRRDIIELCSETFTSCSKLNQPPKPVHSGFAMVLALFVLLSGPSNLTVGQSASNPDGVQLYFFTSDSCPPCRQVEPEIVSIYQAGYPVFKVNAIEKAQWSQHYDVRRTPTVILVKNNRVVKRHSGLINARVIESWFDSVGFRPSKPATEFATNVDYHRDSPTGSSNEFVSLNNSAANLPDTVLNGTRTPANSQEATALQATVRLRVEDPEGTSFATGTVIHSANGQSLVLTCGHVFRDAGGQGEITCEYGFADGNVRETRGELMYFDAEQRDIGLVAIGPDVEITPVGIAFERYGVRANDEVFSVGCDHGESPTIRRTKIKHLAKYSGIEKYDIFGRPVVGRSGGGLFTDKGQLIGVCNAAVVDADEGVYVGLQTIYWQIAKVNLEHLFNGDPQRAQIASRELAPVRDPKNRLRSDSRSTDQLPKQLAADAVVFANVGLNAVDSVGAQMQSAAEVRSQDRTIAPAEPLTLVSNDASNQHPLSSGQKSSGRNGIPDTGQLIVIYQTDESAPVETWRIRNPRESLLEVLKNRSKQTEQGSGQTTGQAGNRMAELRRQMPSLKPSASYQDRPQYRAQSAK